MYMLFFRYIHTYRFIKWWWYVIKIKSFCFNSEREKVSDKIENNIRGISGV